jgi:hypothetical protein
MSYNEEKGKSHKDLRVLGSFNFICVLGAPYYQGGDTLSELVKCKSSKNSFQSKLPAKLNISGLLTGFQKPMPDMFGPQPRHDRATQNSSVHRIYLGPLSGSSKYYRTCLVITFFTVAKSFCRTYPVGQPGYIAIFRHIRFLDRTCPASLN